MVSILKKNSRNGPVPEGPRRTVPEGPRRTVSEGTRRTVWFTSPFGRKMVPELTEGLEDWAVVESFGKREQMLSKTKPKYEESEPRNISGSSTHQLTLSRRMSGLPATLHANPKLAQFPTLPVLKRL